MDDNGEPQVIMVNKTFFPKLPKFSLILGGFFLLSVLGFVSFRLFPLKPSLPPQASPSPGIAKITIPCPSEPQFCRQAKPVVKDGKYLGIGGMLTDESPIFAVFKGKATKHSVFLAEAIGGERYTQVSLTDSSKKMTAVYYIKALTPPIKNSFQKGEEMPIALTQPIEYYNNYHLVFTILNSDQQAIPIEQIAFK